MAISRSPTSGRFAQGSPLAAANATPPPLPQPGLAPQDSNPPLPLLVFAPLPSPCQTNADLAALSTPPGMAGPSCVMPTSPMQDLGTRSFPGDQDTGSST
jgi:hypothetical protein